MSFLSAYLLCRSLLHLVLIFSHELPRYLRPDISYFLKTDALFRPSKETDLAKLETFRRVESIPQENKINAVRDAPCQDLQMGQKDPFHKDLGAGGYCGDEPSSRPFLQLLKKHMSSPLWCDVLLGHWLLEFNRLILYCRAAYTSP